jgi:hypothetical protein
MLVVKAYTEMEMVVGPAHSLFHRNYYHIRYLMMTHMIESAAA